MWKILDPSFPKQIKKQYLSLKTMIQFVFFLLRLEEHKVKKNWLVWISNQSKLK